MRIPQVQVTRHVHEFSTPLIERVSRDYQTILATKILCVDSPHRVKLVWDIKNVKNVYLF